MISRVERRGFRLFGEVSVATDPFLLLVGPNGAGESSFFDPIAIL